VLDERARANRTLDDVDSERRASRRILPRREMRGASRDLELGERDDRVTREVGVDVEHERVDHHTEDAGARLRACRVRAHHDATVEQGRALCGADLTFDRQRRRGTEVREHGT
jgi:hypothetical protein